MRINTKGKVRTHGGAPAKPISVENQLTRSVLSCLLWEDSFYESGESIAHRIESLVKKCSPTFVSELALKARTEYKLRHAPLLLARELARRPMGVGRIIGDTIYSVIQRADELSEFLAIYWKDGKQPLSKQVKLGLARAFRKFDEYQLAKYAKRNSNVSLRKCLRLCHAKPKDEAQALLWGRLIDGKLKKPDTWEVALCGFADKKETFTRLLSNGKLGYLALLKNLRSMKQSGVDKSLVYDELMRGAKRSKALPFRFIKAARAVPAWEPMIDEAMQLALSDVEKLPGKTVLLVDVSQSMVGVPVSKKSDVSRLEAGAALAALTAGVCEDVSIFTFSAKVEEVPSRRGMALVDAIIRKDHRNTYLGNAVKTVERLIPEYDRLIVFTDEQSQDPVPNPRGLGYIINVASYSHGVWYGLWVHIDGFSESVVRYIQEMEKSELSASSCVLIPSYGNGIILC